MVKIRAAFGIFILIFAAWYAFTGFRLLRPASSSAKQESGWHATLAEAVTDAKNNQRPLLLFFTGRACKACAAMKATTFRNPDVVARLGAFSNLSLLADDTQDAEAQELVRHFKITGVPAYFLLAPPSSQPTPGEHSGNAQ